MAKYGYKAGEGLGATGNKGILEPLTAAKSGSSTPMPSSTGGKPKGGWNPASAARGTIVNNNEDTRAIEERARFGEPAECLLLENMVAEDELDEDLPGEIGTCSSFRCLIEIGPN